jgi:von Willebrand factor type A domain-containing protein
MRHTSRLFSLGFLLLAFAAAPDAARAADNFTLTVPNRGPTIPGNNATAPLTRIKLVLNIRRTAPGMGSPTIVITRAGITHNFTAVGQEHEFEVATGPLNNGTDLVVYSSPDVPNVPGNVFNATLTRHRFDLNLLSDFNLTTGASVMNANEDWTVAVTPAADFEIDAACALNFFNPDLTTDRLADLGNVASINSPPPNVALARACEFIRPGIDVVMVLDKSGSMAGTTMNPDPMLNGPKINALHKAVKDMVAVWNGLRTLETDATYRPGGPPTDNVGVVLFESDAAQWPVLPSLLNNFATASASFTDANVDAISPGSATSIGDGLIIADAALTPADPTRRKVVLLMTDGYQNTDKLVDASGTDVKTFTPGSGVAPASLPNQANYDIYTVSVGTASAVEPVIIQQIAQKTGGFMINTETQSALLRPFFLEMLQNFLKFNTFETTRLISSQVTASAPFTTRIPVTSTTESLSINLLTEPQHGRMRLTATPPGGGPAIVEVGSGRISINRRLPLQPPYNPSQPWTVTVELLTGQGTAPFDMTVIGDDHGISTDQFIAPGNYAPGEPIRLQTRVHAFGRPVRGIGSRTGERVVAELVRPGVGVGDMLSDSNAPSTAPQSGDQGSAAQSKLDNTLAEDPSRLRRVSDPTITLRDDGSAASGDAVANDGIYSALYTPQIPGHYNFLFGLEGSTRETGAFSRQQLKTVYVRPLPTGSNTQVSTSVTGGGDRGTLSINMTPRTRFNNRLGPGFANYFWFKAPGRPAFRATDNLNGTYTAQLNFSGAIPPDVEIHFIDRAVMISDETTLEDIGVTLDDSTVLVKHVPVLEGPGFKRWGFSLHGGVSVPHSSNINGTHGPGPNFGADLEYRFNRTFSGELIYTYNRFRGDTVNFGFGPITFAPINLHVLSLNGKVYGNSAPVRPFFNFGGGVYVFSPGVSTHGGMNVGGGLQFDVTPNFAVDSMYNFHNVFVSGSNVQYSTAQGGVRFRF